MRMNRKIIAVASIIAIAAIVISVTSDSALDESTISQTFLLMQCMNQKIRLLELRTMIILK